MRSRRYVQPISHEADVLAQNIDLIRELHRVDGTIGIAVIVIDHLEHARAAEPGERLDGVVLTAGLSQMKGVSHHVLHILRKCPQLLLAVADPGQRFEVIAHAIFMVIPP